MRVEGALFGTVALTELVNATSRVEQYVLTGVERVRLRANFQLNEWVGVTFELNRVAGLNSRTCQELVVARQVVEYHIAVLRVNALFHNLSISFLSSSRFPTEKDCKDNGSNWYGQTLFAVVWWVDNQSRMVEPLPNFAGKT